MELIKLESRQKPVYLDNYGNLYRYCTKCNELKMDYQLTIDTRSDIRISTLCRSCAHKLDKRVGTQERKQYLNSYYNKQKELNKSKKKQNAQERLNKRLIGQKTDIYIRKCVLSNKLFVTTKKNQLVVKGCNIKGEYTIQQYLISAVIKYGAKHKCGYCNIKFDLRVKGFVVNKGNDLGKKVGYYCSKDCSKKDVESSLRDAARRRRARLRTSKVGSFKEVEIYNRDKYKCYICGVDVVRYSGRIGYNKDDAATLDHVIPLAKGGAHSKDNCKTCCRKCNSIKRDSIIKGTQLSVFSYASR